LPALILRGDRDIAFRDKERVRFEELFPKHRTVALEGAGHFVQEDAAPEIIEAVNNWVTHDAQRA
jgi:haloalkane dehalogenase